MSPGVRTMRTIEELKAELEIQISDDARKMRQAPHLEQFFKGRIDAMKDIKEELI
jgi:hypothetical protein